MMSVSHFSHIDAYMHSCYLISPDFPMEANDLKRCVIHFVCGYVCNWAGLCISTT